MCKAYGPEASLRTSVDHLDIERKRGVHEERARIVALIEARIDEHMNAFKHARTQASAVRNQQLVRALNSLVEAIEVGCQIPE